MNATNVVHQNLETVLEVSGMTPFDSPFTKNSNILSERNSLNILGRSDHKPYVRTFCCLLSPQTVVVEEASVVTVVVSEVEEVVSVVETVAVMEVEIVEVMEVDTRWEEGKTCILQNS